jgi:hypothetical protein
MFIIDDTVTCFLCKKTGHVLSSCKTIYTNSSLSLKSISNTKHKIPSNIIRKKINSIRSNHYNSILDILLYNQEKIIPTKNATKSFVHFFHKKKKLWWNYNSDFITLRNSSPDIPVSFSAEIMKISTNALIYQNYLQHWKAAILKTLDLTIFSTFL